MFYFDAQNFANIQLICGILDALMEKMSIVLICWWECEERKGKQ